jgi:hypothetical protein
MAELCHAIATALDPFPRSRSRHTIRLLKKSCELATEHRAMLAQYGRYQVSSHQYSPACHTALFILLVNKAVVCSSRDSRRQRISRASSLKKATFQQKCHNAFPISILGHELVLTKSLLVKKQASQGYSRN